MRTRIALVAIIPVALITVAPLAQAASAPPARVTDPVAAPRGDRRTVVPPGRPADLVREAAPARTRVSRRPPPSPCRISGWPAPCCTGRPVGTKQVTAIVPPPPPPPPAPATGPVDTVTATQRAEWDRVAMCEEGGNWEADGSRFSGGLGITRSNWDSYGGLQYAPEAAEATPDEQIMVAERIQAYPPDQGGCSSW